MTTNREMLREGWVETDRVPPPKGAVEVAWLLDGNIEYEAKARFNGEGYLCVGRGNEGEWSDPTHWRKPLR